MINLCLPLAFAEGAQTPTWASFIPIVAIFLIFYFLLIAPMRKRQKALQTMIGALKRGDRVLTNGGLYGEVASIDESVVYLKIADNVKVKVAKSAIAGLEGEAQVGGERR